MLYKYYRNSSAISSQSTPEENHSKKKKLKRNKKSKSQKKINKRKRSGNLAVGREKQSGSCDDRVTSTTGPSMNLLAEGNISQCLLGGEPWGIIKLLLNSLSTYKLVQKLCLELWQLAAK